MLFLYGYGHWQPATVSMNYVLFLRTCIFTCIVSIGGSRMSEEPNYGQFMELVGHKIIDNWASFGATVGLNHGELEVIGRECPDVQFRFSHVLDKWKKCYYREKPFTWASVVSVLHSMGIHLVADAVVKTFNDVQEPEPN